MRNKIVLGVTLAVLVGLAAAFVGCGPPKVCTVSPIEIEEIKSDSRDLDKQLADVRERLAKEEARLAEWQGRLAERQAEVPQLRVELVRLKKASGVTEEVAEKPKPGTEQAQKDDSLLD